MDHAAAKIRPMAASSGSLARVPDAVLGGCTARILAPGGEAAYASSFSSGLSRKTASISEL
jgi:hypothetical protein